MGWPAANRYHHEHPGPPRRTARQELGPDGERSYMLPARLELGDTMSEASQGPGWWLAADLKWYPPELHADYVAPLPPPPKLPPPPILPRPPRENLSQPSGQPAGDHNSIPAVPVIPSDKFRAFWSGLSGAQAAARQRPRYQHAGTRGAQTTFDVPAIMPGGLMVLLGGLLYGVFGFFPWWTINIVSGLSSYGIPSSSVSFNAWRSGTATFSAIVFLLAAGAVLIKALRIIPAPKIPLELIALGAVALGDLLFLIAFFDAQPFTSRGWGMWIDVVLVIGINVGAVFQFIKSRVNPNG